VAVEDIHDIEALTPERPLGVDFFTRNENGGPCVGLKVWSHGRPIPLSERVPVLENMGFRVVRRADLRGRRRRPRLAARHGAGARRRRPADLGKLKPRSRRVHRGDARRRRERRLQRAGDGGGLGWRDVR
jgi:glutamate dehydrogenase